jgi:hypothetical protein
MCVRSDIIFQERKCDEGRKNSRGENKGSEAVLKILISGEIKQPHKIINMN